MPSPLTLQHKTPTMPKGQPLSPQMPQMPVTFSSSPTQSQPRCRFQQPFTTLKDASTTIRLFFSHSNSLPHFSYSTNKRSCRPNAVAAFVCHRTNKCNCIIPFPLISLSIHFASTPKFLLSPLSFTYNSSTFADITQSAINTPAFLNAPHPTKLPKSI